VLRTLRLIRRHPYVHWAAVLALAATTALIVGSGQSRADAARHAWGSVRSVVVATHDLEAGAVLRADDVVTDDWPAGIAPRDALEVAPLGRTLVSTVGRGEAITRRRVAPDGVHGLAALVPPGWRAIAIAVPTATVALQRGDEVDLLATASDGSVTGTIAEAAIVLAADERAITVALPKDVVARVAGALVTGAVVPALRPPTEGR
jgi:Flp pilus assembly protein CpaB